MDGPYLQSVGRKVELARAQRGQIEQLAELRLIRSLVKQLQQIRIVRTIAKILLQQNVNLRLDDEAVVDRNVANSRTLGVLDFIGLAKTKNNLLVVPWGARADAGSGSSRAVLDE